MNVHEWMNAAVSALHKQFGPNLLFVGLQGSYRRGTATPESLIDMVVIFHKADLATLRAYRDVLRTLPYGHLAHGFAASARDLTNWPRHELPALYADTQPYFGALEPLLPDLHHEDIITSARTSAAALLNTLNRAATAGKELNMAHVNKQAYFTSVLHGAAVRGTFDWSQPKPQMSAEQMLRWLSSVLEEL